MWQSRNAAPRVEVPRPVQLGSLKSENEGQDPGIRLVPAGGGGWGRPKEDVEEPEEKPTNPRVGLTSQPAQLRPTAWGRTSISAQAGPRPAPWAQPAPGTAWQEPVEKKQEEFPSLGSEPKGRRNSGSGSLSLGLGASSSCNIARPIGAPVPAPEKRPVLPPPPAPSPPPAAERRAKDEDSDKAVEKRSPAPSQPAPAKASAERPRTTSEDSDKEFMKTLADKRRAEKKDEEEERSRQQFARAQEKLRLLETRAKERQRQEDEERQEQLRVLRGEVKRDDPYEPMQSDTLEQVVAPAFAEVPPPPAPVPEAAPEPPAAVPEVAPSKATFPKPPPPKKAASFYVPPPVPPPKAPPVPPKQVASPELRPPPKKEAVAPKAASSCSVWGDLDDLRPVRGNADQQFPDISSGPQSKKEKQKTAAKNLVEPVAKHRVQATNKFGHAQRAAPTFALQDLMKPSKKGRSAKIFSGKAALPQQTGAFVEEGAGDPELDAEPAEPAEPVQKPPSPKLTPNGILQRAPREKRDDGSRRVRDPKGEDTEDVEVTIQTQMKIDPQKPLRILQKSAEEKAKEQEAHAPRVEPRPEASSKGVSKGEGKQGKGSGKSKDKGKSKGKGRGPRIYGEDSDAEWSIASSHSNSEEEKESPLNESSPVVVSSEDEDSWAAKPLANQEKGHGKDAKGKGKGKAKGKDKKGGKKGWIVKTKSNDSEEDDEEVHETPAAPETPAVPETGKQQFEKRQRNLKSVLESRAATRAEAERQRKMLREKAAGAEVQPVKVEENSPTSPVNTEQKQEDEEEPPVVPQSSILSEEAMGRLNPVADTGLALGIGMVCVQGEEKQVDSHELLDFETVKNRTEKKAEMREQRRVQEEQATRAAIRREAQRQRDMRAKEAQEAKASQMATEAQAQAPRQQTIKLADLRRNVGKERMESESAEAAQEELVAHVEAPRRQAMKLSDLRYNVPEDQPLKAVPPPVPPPRQETWTTGEGLPYPTRAPPPYRPPDVREQVRKILMAERRAFSAGEANRNPLVMAPPPTSHVTPVPPPAPMPRASAPSVPSAPRRGFQEGSAGKGAGKPFGDADGWETWSPDDWKRSDYCPEWAWAEEEASHAKGAEERRREIMAAANEWRNRKASAKGSKSSPKGKGEAKGKAESKGKAPVKGKGDSKGKADAKGKADGRGKGDSKGGKSKGVKGGQSKGAQWWH